MGLLDNLKKKPVLVEKSEVPSELPSLPEGAIKVVKQDEQNSHVEEVVQKVPEVVQEIKSAVVQKEVIEEKPAIDKISEEKIAEQEKASKQLAEQNARLIEKLKMIEEKLNSETTRKEEVDSVFETVLEEENHLKRLIAEKGDGFFDELLSRVMTDPSIRELPELDKMIYSIKKFSEDKIISINKEQSRVEIMEKLLQLKNEEKERMRLMLELNSIQTQLMEKEQEIAILYEETRAFVIQQQGQLERTKELFKSLPSENQFYLLDGNSIANVLELKDALPGMTSKVFSYHAKGKTNHFAEWVSKCFNDTELALKIKKAKTKEDLIQILNQVL